MMFSSSQRSSATLGWFMRLMPEYYRYRYAPGGVKTVADFRAGQRLWLSVEELD
ncbi:MAG: hypothetical protein GPOALKHO_001232 [Sodalis sp.]|nr:MAG: hypothetical protein GPOALKHO_001232 [Sodalis sp.]